MWREKVLQTNEASPRLCVAINLRKPYPIFIIEIKSYTTMKRVLLVTLALAMMTTYAESQISLRPQIGINFPTLTDEIAGGEFEGNAGYQFGADLQLGGSFYLQPGINFESASLRVREGENAGDLRISRINIPLYAGVRLLSSEDNSIGLRVFAGPNFAIHVNEDLNESFSFISTDNIRDAQVSGIIGAGVDLSILFVDVGYKFGISKFFEDINSDSRIDMFAVNAGVRLGF
jgi:hypothetical protein